VLQRGPAARLACRTASVGLGDGASNRGRFARKRTAEETATTRALTQMATLQTAALELLGNGGVNSSGVAETPRVDTPSHLVPWIKQQAGIGGAGVGHVSLTG